MNSRQGVLWIILWICLNSELLRYHGVQNFAKTDTENAELADAQTAAFSVSTQKPVQPDTFMKFLKRADTRCHRREFFLKFHDIPPPDFIGIVWWVVGICRKNGIHVQRTVNACEAFVMTCRQAAATKPTVWGVAEFGRLAANRRMHGIENAALFYGTAHEIPSSVKFRSCFQIGSL